MNDHDHDGSHHGHHHGHGDHEHGHGNERDQGLAAMWRYLKIAPRMWRSVVNDAVVDMVAPVPGEVVVDIGAGMGPAAMRAAASGAHVYAVEPTPYMRKIVTMRAATSRYRKRVSVVDGSAEEMPVDDHSVDAMWAVNTMHHWNDPTRAAAEVARVLKPNGRAVLVDEDFEDPSHPDHEHWVERHGAADDDHHHGFSMVDAEEIAELFRSAGVPNVRAERRAVATRPSIVLLLGSA